MGKLSFTGCRRGNGKSHHGSQPGVQLSLDLLRFWPGRFEPWIPNFLGVLASVAGSGQRNGTLSLGARVLNPGMSVYSIQSPSKSLTPVSVAQSVSVFGC